MSAASKECVYEKELNGLPREKSCPLQAPQIFILSI
jgi:hypothetical protein